MKKVLSILLILTPSLLLQGQIKVNIIESNNQFAFDIYQKLLEKNKNLIYSPASITSAIAMTYVGAKNNTLNEISNTFYFNKNINDFSKSYFELFKTGNIIKNESNVKIYNANSLWIQEGLKINQDFLDVNKQYFLSSLNYINFIKEPEKSRLTINNWVEKSTNNRIKNLIQPSSIDNTTRLVLVNALYFKGPWKNKFNKENNIESNFQTDKKEYVKTVFMHRYINSWYYSDKNTQVIDIPYSNEEYSLMIILPKTYKKFKKIEKRLNYEFYLTYIEKKELKRINLYLPKFNIESEFDLNKTLSELGIKDAFTGLADFSGITTDEKLFISKVVHKANIAIDEEGTEAAAATSVIMRKTSMLLNNVEFNINKPFIYILRNNKTNCIYFMGKICNPKN